MTDEWGAPITKRKRRWLRRLLWIGGSVFALVVVLYFVATSAWFWKRSLLPRVSVALSADITVQDASISPFSSVTLRGLNVQPRGDVPRLATIAELSARYSLFDIIGGNINIAEITITDPIIEWIENADGTSNLDPLLRRPESPKSEDQPKDSKPLQLTVGKLQISNATIRRVKLRADGSRAVAEVGGLNLSMADVGNGKSGSLNLSSQVRFHDRALSGGSFSTNLLQADLTTALTFALTSDLKPQSMAGDVSLDLTQLPPLLRDFSGAGATLHCEVTPTDVEQFSFVLKKRTATLARISARGPLELAKQEGRIKLEFSGIDHTLLNLIGSKTGIDFGNTSVSATQEIALVDGGQSITAAGKVSVDQLSATRAGNASPALDLQLEYGIALNRTDKTAQIGKLLINGSQNGISFLQGALTQPTTLSFGASSNAVTESAFHLNVTNLNLADWKALIGDYAALVNLNLNVAMKDGGRKLETELATEIASIAAALGSNRVSGVGMSVMAKTTLEQFTRAHITDLRCTLSHHNQRFFSTAISGDYDMGTQEADIQARVETGVPQVLDIMPIPGFQVASGNLMGNARIVQKRGASPADGLVRSVVGDLQLKDASFRAGVYGIQAFQFDLNWDGSVQGNAVQVKKLSGKMNRAGQFGGAFDLSGTYDIANRSADVSLVLSNVNQAVLAPFAQSSLGDKTIKSLSISANTSAKYLPSGDSSLSGTLQLTNVLIDDPKGQLPKTPVAIDVKLDGGFRTNFVALREFAAKLQVGDLPGCAFTAAGEFDVAKKAGRVTLNVSELNENAMRVFLGSALGEKTLKSVGVTADLTAAYDQSGESSLRGQVVMKNLQVLDPGGRLPGEPLSASVQFDSMLAKQVATIRALQLQLSPTARANNMLSLAGRVDMTRSNALVGDLMIASEALDVTPYYDLFVGRPGTNAVATATNAPAARAPSAGNPQEPPPIVLPVQQFAVRYNVNRFYLRDIIVRDWNARVNVEDSRIHVKPFELMINGAAVRADADVNLGVPGYDYALTWNSDLVAVEPLVNSFAPEERGRVKGDLLAHVQVKGAGVTGRSLQKNLFGQFAVQFTNANLEITSPRAKAFLRPVALLLNVPELLNSPVNAVATAGQIGQGTIAVRQLFVVSDTFRATTAGDVRMAEVLTDSPLDRWPMHFELQRSPAERVQLSSRESSGPYVNLPDFLRVGGTLGEPKPLLDKTALMGAAVNKLLKDNLPSTRKPGTPAIPGLNLPNPQ